MICHVGAPSTRAVRYIRACGAVGVSMNLLSYQMPIHRITGDHPHDIQFPGIGFVMTLAQFLHGGGLKSMPV